MQVLDRFTGSRRLVRPKDRAARQRQGHRQPLKVERLEERCVLSYTITDLGTFGGTISNGNAINNRGQVAGASEIDCNCASHPFLWMGGTLQDLGTLGGSNSNGAYGINDLGQVVGMSGGHAILWMRQNGMQDLGFNGFAYQINDQSEVVGQLSSPPDAFLWKDGTTLDLGTLNGGGSTALGINNHTWIVGQSWAKAFLWTPDTGMHALDNASDGTSAATAINDLDQIVGTASSNQFGGTHAVYYSRQGVIDLGTLGGVSEASAVNNLGQVVGDSYTASGPHAFITDLHGGPMIDLNTLIPSDSGWDHLFTAYGINDAGQIVGSGVLPGYDNIHAYLLTPVQSPMVALVPVPPAAEEVRALASDSPLAEGPSGTRHPLVPAVDSWEAPPLPAEESRIPRSVAVVAPQPNAAGLRDTLAAVPLEQEELSALIG